MRTQTLRSQFRSFFGPATFAILALAIASGCTKKKELKNEVDANFYIAKSVFVAGGSSEKQQGVPGLTSGSRKLFHLSRGVEEANSDNTIGATPGMSDDFGLVEARITEKELQFISAFDPRGRATTMNIVASFPIKDHFDILRDSNDFGEKTNKIVEDRKKPWNERAYIRVDWEAPSNSLSNFVQSLLPGSQAERVGAKEENTTLLETPTVTKDGYINFLVETAIKTKQTMSFTFPYSIESPSGYRVTYRTHLMPVKSDDFEAVPYSLKDFQKFGYFFTQQNFENPEKGLQENDIHLYANVHNVCEKGHGGSCATNKITWVLSKDFPEFYKAEARKAISVWNETFKGALNRDDDVVVLDESFESNISDPRYNILAYYPERTNAGLLGVAQWVSNPRNGELVGVRATVYQDGINSTLGSIDTIIDLLKSKDPIADVIKTNPLGTEGSFNSPFNGSNVTSRIGNKSKGRANRGNSSGAGAVTPTELINASIYRMNGDGNKANARLATYVSKIPKYLLKVSESSLLVEDIDNATLLPFPTQIAGETVPNLQGLERFIFAGEQFKSQKAKFMRDAKAGVHGTELVEEAAIRYLVSLIGKGATVEQLDQNRKAIKEKIAKETYYSTLLHEMGHAFGLRHNFRGSSDKANFHKEYSELAAKAAAGDEDAYYKSQQFAMSSIMDYGRDFYADEGGLGPYDRAAIKYAYNRSVDRVNDPIVKRGFAFCTDHEVDESILCRRFDKGSNVSEITAANIDFYNRNYPLMHYRRGRIAEGNWNGWGNPNALINSLLSRVFIPTRQVMDEFLYSLVGGEKVAPADRDGSYCDFKFIRDSIAAGEISKICTPVEMEAAGIDPTNTETFFNALYDPATGKLRKNPATYIPYGMADLLFANKMAMGFFTEVIGSTEPGRYIALPPQKDAKDENGKAETKFALVKLPLGSTDTEALENFAAENQQGDKAAFVKAYLPFVVQVPVSKDARELESQSSREAGYTKTEMLGSWWDKYAAIIALSSRNIGVQKYETAQMSSNVYFSPLTKNAGVDLFSKMIAKKNSGNFVKTIGVKLNNYDKQPLVEAKADAALNADLQAISTMYAIGAFTTGTDMSMLNRLRICTSNEGGCESGADKLPVVEVSINTKTYRAAQTYEGNSISFKLLSEAKSLVEQRAAAVKAESASDGKQTAAIMELALSGELRTRLDTTLAKYPELAEVKTAITDSGAQSAWSYITTITKNLKTAPPFSLQEDQKQITQLFEQAQAAIDADIKGSAGQTEKLADLQLIKKDLTTAVTLLQTIVNDSVAARLAPITKKRATSSLERIEATIIQIRAFMGQEEK